MIHFLRTHSKTKSFWKAQNPRFHACRIGEFGQPQEGRFWNVGDFECYRLITPTIQPTQGRAFYNPKAMDAHEQEPIRRMPDGDEVLRQSGVESDRKFWRGERPISLLQWSGSDARRHSDSGARVGPW
jgi:hypothetical protein